MDWFLTALIWALLAYLLYRHRFFRLPGLHHRFILLVFCVKLIAAAAVYLVYTHLYPERNLADIFRYYDDALIMHRALKDNATTWLSMVTGIGDNTDPVAQTLYLEMNNWVKGGGDTLYNDSRTMIRFNAFLLLLSGGAYQIHVLIFSFLALVGQTALYRVFIRFTRPKALLTAIAVFLLPSVLFWTGGLFKESIAFIGLGGVLLTWTHIQERGWNFPGAALLLLFVMMMAVLKVYLLICLLPAMIFYFWASKTGNRKIWMKFAIVHFAALIISLVLGAAEIASIKQKQFRNLASGTAIVSAYGQHYDVSAYVGRCIPFINRDSAIPAERFLAFSVNDSSMRIFHRDSTLKVVYYQPKPASHFEQIRLNGDARSFLLSLPEGLYNSLIRPSFFFHGIQGSTAAIENILFILLLLILILGWKRSPYLNFVLMCFSFAILLLILSGITVPLLGALVRYRVPALTFLAIAFLVPFDAQTLRRRLSGAK